MKKAILIVLISLLIKPCIVFAQVIPSSSRSREAIIRVEPKLKKELTKHNLQLGAQIYIRIFKKEKELQLWVKQQNGFCLFKTYSICTYGNGSLGPKTRKGDGMAPEGFYYVKPNQLNPWSDFHLSFNLGYPNQYDRYHNRTGSDIMVHGDCVSLGCYAMTDKNIEEIYAMVDAAFRNGQAFFRVHIFPFRMITEIIEMHKNSEWYSFWCNLKNGYDFFTNHGNVPPNVEVKDGRYVFDSSR